MLTPLVAAATALVALQTTLVDQGQEEPSLDIYDWRANPNHIDHPLRQDETLEPSRGALTNRKVAQARITSLPSIQDHDTGSSLPQVLSTADPHREVQWEDQRPLEDYKLMMRARGANDDFVV